ncbi:MAG: metal-dependent transcriptional regulator [Victivallales bacterium]|nr:metal-dependent transcriptional regulator [Victivallales bacterium]
MAEEQLQELSLNQQNYIETIYELCLDHGHAHTKAIADSMGIRMASVTEAIRGLAAKGLVNYKARKNITLTAAGEEIARNLFKRHTVIADFLCNVLGCSRERAEAAACRIEHVIDEKLQSRWADFAQFIKDESEQGEDLIHKFQQNYQNKLNHHG